MDVTYDSLLALLYAKADFNKIPLGGSFELTPRCTLDCKMCYIHRRENDKSALKLEKNAAFWIDLAKKARDSGMLMLLLTGGEPLLRHSVPVYYGNPKIDDYFNPDAFVWCKNEADLDKMLDEVKYLDQNNGAYIEKLMLSPLNDNNYVAEAYEKLEAFLFNIFDQSPEEAQRRVRFFCADRHESFLRDYAKKYKSTPDFIKKIKGIQ